MQPVFQKLFESIERQRSKLLTSVKRLSEEELNRPLAEGKWSIAHILSHLITAERMSVQYIQKKVQGVDQISDTGIWEEAKMILLKISQRLPGLKFRAPKHVVEHTIVYPSIDIITREWDTVRNEFKLLLEKIPLQHQNRMIYRHARVGYLNVKHALVFFREHVTHHTPQIKRLVNQK